MQLRDIVEINQQGLVADAVNLSMMVDPVKNLPLCQGFVFNYDPAQPKFSTLGVLDALRESFHSTNNPNIHLMVQDFGKGKSHFALTVANFFKQPANSPEVEGILSQIKFVASENNHAIYERTKAYKERSKPHLVLCISGEVSTDLGKAFIQALQAALEEHDIADTLAQHFIQDPLNYLQGLSDSQRKDAEIFLESQDKGDLASIISRLQEGQHDLIPVVKNLSADLNNGFPIDFQLSLNIEKMIEDVIQRFCTGENSRFSGILIIFDELNAYLRAWLANPSAAGGSALQNLTNICENNKGKIAFLCLAQVRPTLDTECSDYQKERYERFTTRIELAPTIYEPKSSLELIIRNLIRQKKSDGLWQEFQDKWSSSLRAEAGMIYERYLNSYNGSFDKFYENLGIGCYPLHPLTSYLLCNLEFAQGRTIVGYLKKDVKDFVENNKSSLDGQEKLKFIRSVELIDGFNSNFSRKSEYSDYEKALSVLRVSLNDDFNEDSDEVRVVKAIALFNLSRNKIKKDKREHHTEILSIMTGLSTTRIRNILNDLVVNYQVIYYNDGDNTCRFYSGFSIRDLQRKLEEEIRDRPINFGALIKYCESNLVKYLGGNVGCSYSEDRGDNFVDRHRLNQEDWQFKKAIFSIDEFERRLSSENTVRAISERGLIAYFIGQGDEDMQSLSRSAEGILAKAPQAVQERIIIAIPRRGTGDLARVLLMKMTLGEASTQEKQEFGPALAELNKQFDEKIDTELTDIFNSCIYTCRVIHEIPLKNQKKLEPIVSKMLERLYKYVPPVEGQDKLKSKSVAGAKIINHTSRQLLINDLKDASFPDKSYSTLINTVLVNKWGILKQGNPYTVQVPSDPNIRQAWDTISVMTEINEKEQSITEIKKIWDVLSDAPYGHNELTFTILFIAWLAYHRGEVELSGGFGIPKKKSDTVSHRSAPIHEWVQTNILEKAKDFVQIWVVQMRNKVVRRKPLDITIPASVNYDEALALIEQIKSSRQDGRLDPTKAQTLEASEKQLQKGIVAIDTWLQPTQEAKALLDNQPTLDALARFYEPLEANPPVIIKDGMTTVRATETQTNTWRQTRQALRDKIEALVENFTSRAQSFTSADQGYTLNAEINHQIPALEAIANLPSRFIDSLKVAQDSINQRVQALQESEKTQEVLGQIQKLHETLGTTASQGQYDSVLANIKHLAAQYLAVQQEETYLRVLQDIETQQDDLTRKLDQWESQFASLSSKGEAYQLSEEINQATIRFDQEDSQQRIYLLKERIKARILEQENDEQEEANLQATVEQARQKLQSIAKSNNVAAAIQFYDGLSQLVLPSTQDPSDADGYHHQLDQLKAEGRQAIEQKIEQLLQECDREIKRSEEYNQRKAYIARAKSLVDKYADLAALQDKLKAAEDTLNSKYEDLKKKAEDVKLLRDFQNLRAVDGNTIKRCEEIIARIEDVRSKLNFAEQHNDSIDRLLKTFHAKRTEHIGQLDELANTLKTVDNINQLQQIRNELSKLDLIFRDSTEYEHYREVEGQLRNLTNDLDRITRFESQGQSAQSITTIQGILSDLSASRRQLHEVERFQERLQYWEVSLQQRQQQYIDELNQWQQDLETLSESNNARKLHTQVASKTTRYAGSEYEEVYEALSADLEAITRLLELVDIQKTDTLDDCQTEIERLDGWRSNQASLSERLEQRIQAARRSLIQTQQAIQERERHAAQQQLSSLLTKASQLDATDNTTQKLADAKAILKEIRQVRSQYAAFLEDAQKDALRDCQQRCEDIQAQDQASQIEILFQQLPKEKRVELYQRLSTYLEATTEVF